MKQTNRPTISKVARAGKGFKLYQVIAVGLLILGLSSVIAPILFGPVIYGNGVAPNGQITALAPAFPATYNVQKVAVSLTHKFNIGSEGNQNLGSVQEQFLAFGRTFKLYDGSGALAAVAHQRVFAWGTTVDIFDSSGKQKLATLKENVLQSMFKAITSYQLLSANNQVIAESEKVELLATTIRLKDKAGKVIVTLERPFFNFPTDRWTVSTVGNGLDSRIAPIIAAYKSSADAERRADSDSKSDDSDSSESSSGSSSSRSRSSSSK
ncbi:MAG: hypothetical protein SFV17_05300 [Candidatus Obscuribacter sp.]|nr:hypothetical protein [Candidatus Obscuribacter sp.]